MRRLLTLIVLTFIAVPALGAGTAQAAKCDVKGKETTFGPTSVSSVTATGVLCSAALKVVKAYHTCRLKNGPAGRCVKKVSGYSCREARTGAAPQFSAKTTCVNGKRKVVHSYVQNV